MAPRILANPDGGGATALTVTPLGAVARGLVAGAVGTAVMDTFLLARYRRAGGARSAEEWESSAGVTSWEQAPRPHM
jgi:hypothetical protein